MSQKTFQISAFWLIPALLVGGLCSYFLFGANTGEKPDANKLHFQPTSVTTDEKNQVPAKKPGAEETPRRGFSSKTSVSMNKTNGGKQVNIPSHVRPATERDMPKHIASRPAPAHEQPEVEAESTEPRPVLDMGPGPRIAYKDEVQKKTLGPSRWMAQVDVNEAKKIDEEIDASPAKEILRKQAQENALYKDANVFVRKHVISCVSSYRLIYPHARGNVHLSALLQSAAGRGTMKRLKVFASLELNRPQVRDCITQRLRSSFVTKSQESITIENAKFAVGL